MSKTKSVNKCPESYEEYRFGPSEQYRKIALDELRESDEIREQALQQMREWVAKNPAIKTCRTDGPFLLRFLRGRKFNHNAACENLERYLAVLQSFPTWFQKLDTAEPWVDEMIDDWPILPLGYDEAGRLVIMIKIGNFDVDKFTNVHQVRLMMMIMESYQEEEKIQIAGCVIVFEDSGLTMSHVAQWPISDIKIIVECLHRSFPQRVKEMHVVNLPRYAIAAAELGLGFASEKVKKRVQFHRSMDSLTKAVRGGLFPKEYGGDIPICELKKRLRSRLSENRDRILALDEMRLDQARCSALWKDSAAASQEIGDEGLVGSFRKLNVD